VRGTLLGIDLQNDRVFYYACLLAVSLVILFVLKLLKSPYGLSLLGARENERRMMSVGYNVYVLRLKAYILSAFIVSIAGALYAFNHQFVTLEMVHWRASGESVMITLLGGAGTIFGPILGAGIVLIMRNALSAITDNGSLYLGILFVTVVMFARRGILGELMHRILDRGGISDSSSEDKAVKNHSEPAVSNEEAQNAG
jgi:branched-chain amino acid transport system permease protein